MWDLNRSPDHNDDGADSQQFCFPVLEMGPTPGALAGSVAAELVASSFSSSSARRCKYDVFLSFRGPDTRKGITVEIRDQLQSRGVITFMDDRDLEPGDPISRKLIEAIEGSRFAIVVLSRDYASSAWCLEELAKICECMEDNRILPLFYNVEPSNVRHQKKRSFGEAFSKHETSGRHTSKKIQLWRDALKKVASFSGWDSNNFKTERELVEAVVDSVCKRIQPFDVEFTMSTGDFEEFGASRKAMGEVMKALIDDNVTAIGVYGMGGVGKTTLVKHVAEKCRKSGIFHDVIMAVVSQSLDLKKIQDTLADLLGFELKKKTEAGRAKKLHKEIMRKEKLLIIVDDVWERTELSKIGIPSYKELQQRKSKVLLTTRRLNVCHAMECQAMISLNILSEEDSLTLFLRNARIMSFESTTFEKAVKRVAAECKGLPIALIAVARALGDKDLAEWEKAAQRLEKSQSANPAFKCMKLSYDYLKDEEYKSFFLLCCLFPEDDDIKIEDLFRYAIGIGLFGDAETMYEARGTAYTVVEHLKDSNLLLESDLPFLPYRCVRMHDVVRDTALNIAKSEDGYWFFVKAGCGLKGWLPHGLHEGCTAISLMRNEIRKLPEEELVCPNLQILLLNGNAELSEIPEKLIQNLKELRVLDLSNTSISALPQSFSLLTNLQALYLNDCGKLIDISVVGKLKKLEILSMRGCPRGELLREIGHLTNLRILDVNPHWGNGIVTIPSKVILKLHKLEEMYMDADAVLPNLTTVVASDDGNETETASPEQSYEVEEIFSDATIEIEPAMSESNEVVKLRIRATSETEPTMSKLTEDFEPVEATTQATNGHCEPAPQWKHDVFLSFRGEDTRKGFLSHLYHELQTTKMIRTFKDDEQLKKGKVISQSLLTAIEESRFAIIVLSEHYAFSAWCLDELTKIFQCMEDKDTILPIFYHVDPCDVRYQMNSYEVALTKHESKARHDIQKVKQWRADLTKVGNLSGWDSKNHKSERELVEDIVKVVLKEVLQVPRGDFEEFEATREAMVEVNKMLKDDKITAIGVYGRGGVGKTAMVKHVGAQAKRNGLFDHVVIAVISRNPDLKKIQGALVNQLGVELVQDEELERASRLKERIMGGKRILIILDDIWEKIDLSSIGIPSYDELQRCNSKVLLTTRIRNLSHSMGCQAHIPLNILSEEDSLKLLMKKSRRPFHASADSYEEERNVVGKCGGLPSVLEEAARAFGHKYMEEWNEAVSKAFGDNDDELQIAAQEVNASQLVLSKDERDIFKRIELSYQTLRFDDAKSFFLLCCMFPEDYDIPIEELLKYGIGNGLFQYSDTFQEARDRAHSLVAYLKASGLLLDGKKGCIRMHFDIRNVAMSIALSEGQAFFVKAGCELKDWPMAAHEDHSAISLMRNKLSKLPETLVCSKLQILLLQGNAGISEIPNTFFQSPNALRVFDLSYTSISVLPSTFNLLTNLQALHLDCCSRIIDISILGNLKKVEILSLRKFPHKEFPKEIGNLTSLRILDVTGGCVHKIPSKVISRLYRLEELYMKCEFGNWGSKVEEAVGETNADFDEIIGLSRLNILKVYISDAACLPKAIGYFEPNWVKFDICISRDISSEMMLAPNDQHSRTLTLDRTVNGLSDWFINIVMEKAERLEYRECKGLKYILEEYEHGRLHGLKHLSVIGCHENLEDLINAATWDPSKPVFESLEELHLLHLQRLKELCVSELPVGSLCKLKLLKVQTCRNLVNALLPPKLLRRLTNLETIFCVNMEQMKYVFGAEGLEHGTILLEKLSELRLCVLFELISIWNGPAPHAVFRNLKVMAVWKCSKLKNLFPFDVARSLVQLEDLSVEHCPSLGRVIEASNSVNRYIVFLGLKKLALTNLPQLTCFCTENGTFAIECPLLEYLYVDKCPLFINSASASASSSASVRLNDQQHLNSLAKRWEDMY